MAMRLFRLILVMIAGGVLLSCGADRPELFKESRASMDTLVSVTVVSASEAEARAAIDQAFSTITSLGRQLDFFSPDSEVTAINRAAGERPVRVSPPVLDIIAKALSVSEQSGGAFDITIGPVSALWDFHAERLPDPAALRKALPLVNYKDVVLDAAQSTVFLKRKGMKIDLGAIAKGYAADRAVETLRERGITAGLVAVAGDIKAFGLKPDGSAWRIGIKNPRPAGASSADELLATTGLRDRAVSTSGDYERFFIREGVRYHHLIDPRTGYPVNHCRGASVFSREGALADAFSTAVCILGPEKGMQLLHRTGIEGLIIGGDGAITVSEGLKGTLEFRTHKS